MSASPSGSKLLRQQGTELGDERLSPVDAVFAYHKRSKHRFDRYAKGPETLDWTSQPSPYREFAGSLRFELPLRTHRVTTTFAGLHAANGTQPQAFSLESVGALLALSMGLSAWKESGPDRWAVRCNPSSGNLHPTEAYVLSAHVPGLEDGLFHYLSRDHSLEQRCRFHWTRSDDSNAALWIGLASVHWREAWKYGERAFRYCQLDIGHALDALRYAAAALGWSVRLIDADTARLAHLLGLDREEDFTGAELEEPDVLVCIARGPGTNDSGHTTDRCEMPAPIASDWCGRANVLDPHPMYHWPVIDEVAAATHVRSRSTRTEVGYWPYPPLPWNRHDLPDGERVAWKDAARRQAPPSRR